MFIRPETIPSTGNGLIDAAHERLARISNKAYDLWLAGETGAGLIDTLDEFVLMVAEHFDEEIDIIREAGYDRWEFHRALHDKFLGGLRLAAEAWRPVPGSPGTGPTLDAFRMIDDLMYEHEFLQDQDFWGVFREDDPKDGPLIAWDPSYEIGEEKVDRQHRALISLINRMHADYMAGCDRAEIVRQFEGLATHVAWHFVYEERLMATHHLPGFLAHRELHNELLAELERMLCRLRAGDFAKMPDVLGQHLKFWLIDHMTNVDRHLGEQLAREAGNA